MNRILKNLLLGMAACATVFTVAGWCSTATLTFGFGTGQTGTFTDTSGIVDTTGSGVGLSSLSISGAPDDNNALGVTLTGSCSGDACLQINSTGTQLTVTGTADLASGDVTGTLLTMNFTGESAVTATASLLTFNIASSAVTSISELSALTNALNLTGWITGYSTGGASYFSLTNDTCSGTCSTSGGTYKATSTTGPSVELAYTTPEPVSMFLMGTGLIGMAILGRKRLARGSKENSPKA